MDILITSLLRVQEILHLLSRHAGVPESHIHYLGSQLDSVLQLPVKLSDSDIQYDTGEEQNAAVIQAYDNLCKLLRQLDDLPLTFTSLQGVSPCFRYTEVIVVIVIWYTACVVDCTMLRFPLTHKVVHTQFQHDNLGIMLP